MLIRIFNNKSVSQLKLLIVFILCSVFSNFPKSISIDSAHITWNFHNIDVREVCEHITDWQLSDTPAQQ